VSQNNVTFPKTFNNNFTLGKSFCVKFCTFVSEHLYSPQVVAKKIENTNNSLNKQTQCTIDISTNFDRFNLIFNEMELIAPQVGYHRFHLSIRFEYSPRK